MSTGSRHDEPEQQGPQALYPVAEIKRLYRTISELRAEVEALRRERDNWKAGYDNWKARYDEWRPAANYAQSLSAKGLLPARMLGMHCGDALVALVESMRAERDELARRNAEMAAQVSGLLDEHDELVDGQAGLRAKIRELAARLEAIERQEPSAWVLRSTAAHCRPTFVTRQSLLSCAQSDRVDAGDDHLDPLYARPAPAAEPVLLSDEQVIDAYRQPFDGLMDHVYEYGTAAEGSEYYAIKMARSIEAAVLKANGMMVGDAPLIRIDAALAAKGA